jgi:hypothetical protein
MGLLATCSSSKAAAVTSCVLKGAAVGCIAVGDRAVADLGLLINALPMLLSTNRPMVLRYRLLVA